MKRLNYKHQFDLEHLLLTLKALHSHAQHQCTEFFATRLNILQRKFIAREVQVKDPRQSMLFFLNLGKYFFKELNKLQDFWTAFDVAGKYGKPLNDFYLTILG